MRTKIGGTSIGVMSLYSLSKSMIVILTFSILSVSMAQSFLSDFFRKHGNCFSEVVTMLEHDPWDCSVSLSFMKCSTEVVEDFYPEFTTVVKDYKTLVEEGCHPNSDLFTAIESMYSCLQEPNDKSIRCVLDGEFERFRDACSSLEGAISCQTTQTEIICGKRHGNVNRKLLDPLMRLFNGCVRSRMLQGRQLSGCNKGILECNRYVFTGRNYTCSDMQRTANCFLNYLPVCTKYAPIVERYIPEISEYCDPESLIRKNLKKSYVCILSSPNVLDPCHMKFAESMGKDIRYQLTTSKERLMEAISLSLDHFDCMARQMGIVCGEEAEFSFIYIVGPFAEYYHDVCLKMSGERCSTTLGQNNSSFGPSSSTFGPSNSSLVQNNNSFGLSNSLNTTLMMCIIYALYSMV